MQVIVEAGFEFSFVDVFLRQAEVTCAHKVILLDEIKNLVHHPHVAVWTEVGSCFGDNVSRLENPGVGFVADADGRVGLIVLQQHVIARLVVLDKIVLKQQGVGLRVNHHIAYVGNLVHQYACLSRLFFIKIGAHAALERLGFPHVDDGAILVEVLIATRALREIFHNPSEVVVTFQYAFKHGVPGVFLVRFSIIVANCST